MFHAKYLDFRPCYYIQELLLNECPMFVFNNGTPKQGRTTFEPVNNFSCKMSMLQVNWFLSRRMLRLTLCLNVKHVSTYPGTLFEQASKNLLADATYQIWEPWSSSFKTKCFNNLGKAFCMTHFCQVSSAFTEEFKRRSCIKNGLKEHEAGRT